MADVEIVSDPFDENDDLNASRQKSKRDLDKFIEEAMATDQFVKIKTKRIYVTKTHSQWAEEFRELYREFELASRKAYLIKLDKSLMFYLIKFYFNDVEPDLHKFHQSLATKRFRQNTNTWKSKSLSYFSAHVQREVEENEKSLGSKRKVQSIWNWFHGNYKSEQFEKLLRFLHSWVDVSRSSKYVKAWCHGIYAEICTTIRRHHLYIQGIKDHSNPHAILEWKWVLKRYDELPTILKKVKPKHIHDVFERPREAAPPRKQKSDAYLLTADQDAGVVMPDEDFLAQYAISDTEDADESGQRGGGASGEEGNGSTTE